MGINFLKQYSQAGLSESIPMVVSAASMDKKIIAGVQDIAVGIHSTSHWNHDMDNAANKKFLAGFAKTYDREPTVYASQGYDTAKLIASALKATGGKVLDDKDAFRAALKAAKFDSVRGEFRFNNNQHPINNWVGRVVEKQADGTLVNKMLRVVSPNHEDAYAKECALK